MYLYWSTLHSQMLYEDLHLFFCQKNVFLHSICLIALTHVFHAVVMSRVLTLGYSTSTLAHTVVVLQS